MIKAIFFDVDGTLLSHRTGRISPHTRACIRALRAGGTLVFLSTGRHILELRSLPVGEMAFDGYITLNGQLCLDSSQQQLSSTPLPPQAVQALADLFCADGPPLALVEEERIYINRVTDAVRQAQAEISTPIPEVAPYTGRPVYQATPYLAMALSLGAAAITSASMGSTPTITPSQSASRAFMPSLSRIPPVSLRTTSRPAARSMAKTSGSVFP